jgi:AraC-like DNA-binding protein
MAYNILLKRDLFEILTVTGSSHEFPVHMHRWPCAERVDCGARHVFMGGKDHLLLEGDIFFIPAGVPHSCRADEGGAVSYTVLTIHDFKTVTEEMLLRELEAAGIDAGDISAMYRRIISGSADTGSPDSRIAGLMSYIDENCLQELPAKDLAALTGLSVHHLLHRFTEETGISLHRYIIQSRLRRSRRAMSSGGDISGTALDCGFFDQSHFTRHFLRHTGITPGRYMESLKDI